ncbi:hypothetical protein IWQ62_004655 [Dispira parvispora]|uniref:Uncharacterized protein n=1 Tax=Dispira parvispora TaxID=1520584 RepID=A0A9W8AL74_9FUNG|nr:hypothetical protein IWQ62_004655 [Dispira parvispora]
MPKNIVHDKGEGGTLSERKHLKQNRRGNRRQANRDRSGGAHKRKHNSNTTPNPGPSPSGGSFHPITSAAEFTKEHMDALHIVPVLNCPIEEVIPVSHCPEDLLYRIRPFWTVSREDLYNLSFDRLELDITEAAKGSNESSEIRKTCGIRACTGAVANLMDVCPGYESYELGSDGVTKSWSKITMTACADMLCNEFVANFTQLYSREFPSWHCHKMTLDTQVLPEWCNFTVRPDKVIFYAQARKQKTPFAWITINPSCLAPTADKYESTLPQVAAQTIAMARYHPREVFGIQFSYRYVTFWRAVIPENYLDLLNDSGDLPPDVSIEMKRSTVLDIEQPDGRYEFSRALLSLLMYWNEQVSCKKEL